MGVNRVVDDCPADVGHEQTSCRPENLWMKRVNLQSGATDEDGPSEGKTKHDLWIVCDPLRERIQHKQQGDRNCVVGTFRWKIDEYGYSGQAQGCGEEVTLSGTHGTPGNRSKATAKDFSIEFLIGVVVPATCGTTQDNTPDQEQAGQIHHVLERRWRVPDTGGIAEADDVGEIECVETCWFLETHQFGIGHKCCWQHG